MAEKTEIELRNMSEEELESFIRTGGQTNEGTQTQETELETDDDTTQEPEQDPQEVEEETEESEEVEAEPETGQPQEDDIPERYRGKTQKELIEMIENGTRVASRQGNELGQLRRQMSELQASIDKKFDGVKPTQAEQDDFVQDLIENRGYDKNDIDVISQLVQREANKLLTKIEKEQQEKLERQRQEVSTANQDLWDDIKDIYPNADELETKMVAAIQKDPENTLYKKGWVKSFLRESKKQTTSEPTPTPTTGNGVKKRIVKTTTVKTGSRPSIRLISRADLDSSDPETYRRAWNHFNPNDQI